jgi:hypothetical protein
MDWTVKRRYQGDTRSSWVAKPHRLRSYRVWPAHGCYGATSENSIGNIMEGEFVNTPSQGRELCERWHEKWLAAQARRTTTRRRRH